MKMNKLYFFLNSNRTFFVLQQEQIIFDWSPTSEQWIKFTNLPDNPRNGIILEYE